jgi:hypothetical protein
MAWKNHPASAYPVRDQHQHVALPEGCSSRTRPIYDREGEDRALELEEHVTGVRRRDRDTIGDRLARGGRP